MTAPIPTYEDCIKHYKRGINGLAAKTGQTVGDIESTAFCAHAVAVAGFRPSKGEFLPRFWYKLRREVVRLNGGSRDALRHSISLTTDELDIDIPAAELNGLPASRAACFDSRVEQVLTAAADGSDALGAVWGIGRRAVNKRLAKGMRAVEAGQLSLGLEAGI